MKPQLQIASYAASYGASRQSARYSVQRGDVDGARFWAKHARADFRQLCRLAGLESPKPHATSDFFSL